MGVQRSGRRLCPGDCGGREDGERSRRCARGTRPRFLRSHQPVHTSAVRPAPLTDVAPAEACFCQQRVLQFLGVQIWKRGDITGELTTLRVQDNPAARARAR